MVDKTLTVEGFSLNFCDTAFRPCSASWMRSCIPAFNNAAMSHSQLQLNLKKIHLPHYTTSASLIMPPYDFSSCPLPVCAAPIEHSLFLFPVLWLKRERLLCS